MVSTDPLSWKYMAMQHELIAEFRDLVGHDLVVTSPADLSPLTKDWRGRYEGQALCAVYPRST